MSRTGVFKHRKDTPLVGEGVPMVEKGFPWIRKGTLQSSKGSLGLGRVPSSRVRVTFKAKKSTLCSMYGAI